MNGPCLTPMATGTPDQGQGSTMASKENSSAKAAQWDIEALANIHRMNTDEDFRQEVARRSF
jgi:hypothetical protein